MKTTSGLHRNRSGLYHYHPVLETPAIQRGYRGFLTNSTTNGHDLENAP
jgi:hypothetical protein